MKKLLLTSMLTLCMTANAFAISDLTAKTDYSEEKIVISGLAESDDTEITVFALNPGKTFSDIETDGAVQHFRKIDAENNKFSYSFKIHNPETNTGWITCYVKETDGEYGEVRTYVASKSEIDSMINDILENGTASKIDNDVFVNVFETVNSEMYEKTEKTALAARADAYLEGFVRTELEADRKAVTKLIKQAYITEAYNQKIDVAFIDEDGKLTDEDAYEIDKKDAELKTNALEIFNTILSDGGKKKVVESLKGNDFETFDELVKMFMEKTMLYGLNNAKELGYEQTAKILTAANKSFLGISVNVSDTGLQKKIASAEKDFETAADLETFIKNNKPASSGGSGSGSSSGGGKSSAVTGGIGGASYTPSTSQTPAEQQEMFDDIDGVEWAKEAIEALCEKEIINGKGNGIFDPDGYITREEFVKIAAKAFNLEYNEYKISFDDVDTDSWYAPYVSAAFEKGIITGIDEKNFGTGENISREDICVIVYRIIGNGEYGTAADFEDYDEISEYAKDAVDYMTDKGAVSGFPDGTFRPKAPCTRAEAAKIIYKAAEGLI